MRKANCPPAEASAVAGNSNQRRAKRNCSNNSITRHKNVLLLCFLGILSKVCNAQYSGLNFNAGQSGGSMFSTDLYGNHLSARNNTITDLGYGLLLSDRSLIPRGPRFLIQPNASVFDLSGRSQQNYVQLACSADGYPTPVYSWYKEEYSGGGQPIARLLDPLQDSRLTLTDGVLTIHNPQQQTDRGKYHCRAGNSFGWIRSHSVQLSFGFIGEFSKKRSADIGRANWGKSISCDAPQHHPTVNYYWVKNRFPSFVEEDQRVFVSQDGNLYFSSLEIVDNANYSCNVQSVISSTGRTGPFFALMVEPSPNNQKLLFPNSFPKAFPEAPLAGQPVRLECVAFGYPVPTYNWTRRATATQPSSLAGSSSYRLHADASSSSQELPLPRTARISSHGRVLHLESVSVSDAGEYICSAISGREVISKSVTLAIQSLPTFTTPLVDRVLEPGATLQWTCDAFAIPPADYQWFRDGELLQPHTLSPADSTRYSIQRNRLLIQHVQPERDAAMYQCVAANQLGASFSSAQLKIATLAPLFRQQAKPLQQLFVGEQANFTLPCAPEALPAPEISWRREGVQIVFGGKFRLLDGGELLVSPLNLSDAGLYTCRAANELGWAEYSVKLEVLPLPRFSKQPSPRVSAVQGDALELPCEAYATSPLDVGYRWLLNGREIRLPEDGGDRSRERGYSIGYLRLVNVSFADAGRYTCEARSSAGSIFANTELLVAGPPDAPGALQAEQISASSAKLSWIDGAANGRAIIAYNIEAKTNHDSGWQQLSRYVTAFATELSAGGIARRFVQLRDQLNPWSTYEFRVSAINELGVGRSSASSPLYNTEQDRPYRSPANVGGGGGKAGTLTITWDPLLPQNWHAPQIWYRIQYRLASERGQPALVKELRALGNVGMYTLSIAPEHYYTAYEVRVQAVNEIGEGPLSAPSIVYSAEAMPQIQPSMVRVEPHNSTALLVSWAPVDASREKMRGRLIGHRIKYWRNGKDAQQDALTLLNRNEDNHGLIVALLPNTEYFVSVMAYNDAGSGPESEPALSRTYKSAPLRPPVNVQVYAVDSTTIRVTWRGVTVTSNEEPIIGYKVRYWQTDQPIASAKEAYKYLDGQDLEAIIPGLAAGKTYKLRVLAYSKGGDGKMSSPAFSFRVTGSERSMYTL